MQIDSLTMDELEVARAVFEDRVHLIRLDSDDGSWELQFEAGCGLVLRVVPLSCRRELELSWVQPKSSLPSRDLLLHANEALFRELRSNGLLQDSNDSDINSANHLRTVFISLLPILAAAERVAQHVRLLVDSEKSHEQSPDGRVPASAPLSTCISHRGRVPAYLTIVQLDHIRSLPRYVRSLQRIAASLLNSSHQEGGGNVHVTLLLTGELFSNTNKRRALSRHWRLILVCVESSVSGSGTAFLRQLRELEVDVDSQGRPCKERQGVIIAEDINMVPPPANERSSNLFDVVQLEVAGDWFAQRQCREEVVKMLPLVVGKHA